MTTVKAWAAFEPKGELKPFTYEMPPLGPEDVEIQVEHCGICHTDIAFINNEIGNFPFPFVPGHEITGRIVALGEVAATKGLKMGQKVGVGWMKSTCNYCDPCQEGRQNLCLHGQATIMGNHGGWAQRVRTDYNWAVPMPEELEMRDAGPLMCAGITVFAPLMESGIKPTDNVAVFGIGGLGHLAVQFAAAWGADVTAFSNSPAKVEEIKRMGATHIVNSRDVAAWEPMAGSFDLIIVTVAVPLDWGKIISLLAPNGRLHIVGILMEPIPVPLFPLLVGQKSLSSSPGGSRSVMTKMLRFAARHKIAPITEHWPMSKVNEALRHLESGNATYRIVLDADF